MFQCRFYEREWPEEGEIVVVKVKDEIFEGGLYCTLMEYNGIEGYVPISEMTRLKRRSNRPSAMKKGQLDLAKVDTVDMKTGCIDLNKEQLPPEVVEKVTRRWNNSKKINSIMKSVAYRVESPVEELYRKFLWPLARDMKKLGKNTITGLSCFLNDPEGMTKKYNLRQNFVDALIPLIRQNLKPKQHRIAALIQVNSFSWQGVTLIKKALKAGALVSTPSCPVQIVLREPPSTWEIKIHTLKPEEGSIVIWKILEKIRRVLTLGKRGQFRLIKAPVMRDPYKVVKSVACQDPKIQIVENPLFDYSADYGSAGNKCFIEDRASAEKRTRKIQFSVSSSNSNETEKKDKLSRGTATLSAQGSISKKVRQKNDIEVETINKGNAGGKTEPYGDPHEETEGTSFSGTRVPENPSSTTTQKSQLPVSQQVQDKDKNEIDKLELAELEGAQGSPGFPALLEKPFSVPFSLVNGKETKNKPLASIPSDLLPPPYIRHSSNVGSRPKVSGYHLIRPVHQGRNITDPIPYIQRSAVHKYPHPNELPSIDQELTNFVRASKPSIPDIRDQSKTTESPLRKIATNQQEDNMSGSAAGTGDSLPLAENLRPSNPRD